MRHSHGREIASVRTRINPQLNWQSTPYFAFHKIIASSVPSPAFNRSIWEIFLFLRRLKPRTMKNDHLKLATRSTDTNWYSHLLWAMHRTGMAFIEMVSTVVNTFCILSRCAVRISISFCKYDLWGDEWIINFWHNAQRPWLTNNNK